MDSFLEQLEEVLSAGGPLDKALTVVLGRVLERLGCVVGTIHRLEAASQELRLCAQRGLPPKLLPTVERVPVGKGMAGLAASRRRPVQVCNLQQDASGDARPGAKLTQMEGSVAVPMLVGDDLRGTLGVAKPVVYEFTDAEIEELAQIAALIGRHFD